MVETRVSNREQIEFWNGTAAERWVRHQELLDRALGAFGVAAMDRLAPSAGESILDVATAVDAIELGSDGSFIDAELMSRADRMGFRIVQVGLDYFPRSRGVSTLSSWSTIFAILREWRALAPAIRRLGPPGIGTSR